MPASPSARTQHLPNRTGTDTQTKGLAVVGDADLLIVQSRHAESAEIEGFGGRLDRDELDVGAGAGGDSETKQCGEQDRGSL